MFFCQKFILILSLIWSAEAASFSFFPGEIHFASKDRQALRAGRKAVASATALHINPLIQ
jgi:hypothetical protein